MWDMRRNVDHSRVPAERAVIQSQFTDAPTGVRNWWLIITPEEVDVRDMDPGHPVAAAVTTACARWSRYGAVTETGQRQSAPADS
jgi:hypothetical protein